MRYKITQSPLGANLVILYDTIEDKASSSCLLEDLLLYENDWYLSGSTILNSLKVLYEFESKEQFILDNPDLLL